MDSDGHPGSSSAGMRALLTLRPRPVPVYLSAQSKFGLSSSTALHLAWYVHADMLAIFTAIWVRPS